MPAAGSAAEGGATAEGDLFFGLKHILAFSDYRI